MPIPALTASGDLPAGVHEATLAEVIDAFGSGSLERVGIANRLRAIHRLATSTGKVRRFVVFGSFITAKPAPGDVDLFLLMEDDFAVDGVTGEAAMVFDHAVAQDRLGASLFWMRAIAALGGERAAVEYWQVTRDGGRRGIVEIVEPSL
jgi:hypothetical protein